MNITEIETFLHASGFRIREITEEFIKIEDPSCFVRDVVEFAKFAWPALGLVTTILLIGWAVTMIRGAENKIMENLRSLTLIFGIVAVGGYAINMIYGEDRFARGCKTITVRMDEVQKLLEARKEKLKNPQEEYLHIRDSFEYDSDYGRRIENLFPKIGDDDYYDEEFVSLDGKKERQPPKAFDPNGVNNKKVVKADKVLSEDQLNNARSVINKFGLGIKNSGSNGRLGANRNDSRVKGGKRGHEGTDLYVGGQPPPTGTPIPALFSGTVISSGTPAYTGDYRLTVVKIQNDNGTISKMMYMKDANLNSGERVRAGQIVGYVQDIRQKYKDEYNHVHYELIGKNGELVNIENLLE
jgi:murein DD-endopeptidase MepM/ murein hydrolase activator NlpD